MATTERLYRFVFERADVRGEIVQLQTLFAEVVDRAGYVGPLRQIVGEALAATCLLIATLKFRGALTLQLQSEGPLRLLVVEAGSDGGVRAMARTDGELPDAELDRQARRGALAITIEPDDGSERYQGVVDLVPGSIAAALEKYFQDSEQLPTRVWLSTSARRAAGILLQRLPGKSEDADAWERAGHLAQSLTGSELRGLDVPEILHRLFHQEDIRLFEPTPLRFHCRCSRERVAAMIRALGGDEAREILAEQGHVEVCCEFCSQAYRFDPVDVEQLLADPGGRPPSRTQH